METTPPTTERATDHDGKPGGHVLAFLGGVFVLLLGFRGSLGAGLLAPAAMVIASGIWERRGRKLSATGHWVAALCGAAIVYVLFSGIVTKVTSEQSWNHMRRVADSVQKASATAPPPAWLQRIAPAMAARHARPPTSERAQTIGIAFGAAFGAFLWVGLYGSIAWAGGMLVGYGVNGRWPGSAAGAPPPDSAAPSLG